MGYYIKVESKVKVYVEDINLEGKETIVFLHGWPGSHELFEYQFNRLPQMGYRCIGIDQRGFGKSDRPFTGYDYDRLSDDVRVIVDTIGLKDFTLVGHSTGGAIAIRYMSRHKGCGVKKLVLCAAAAPSLIKRPNFDYGLKKEEIDQMINDTYNDRPNMLKNFGNSFFFKHTTEAFSEWFFNLGLQAAGWGTIAIEKSWIKEELFSDLEQIDTETLIMHGIHDKVCLFELAEEQKKRIKKCKLVAFEESGHGLFYDQCEKFNRELMKFIKE